MYLTTANLHQLAFVKDIKVEPKVNASSEAKGSTSNDVGNSQQPKTEGQFSHVSEARRSLRCATQPRMNGSIRTNNEQMKRGESCI